MACGTLPKGSVAGSDCTIAHTPEYAVKGKTQYDQNWVDRTTERLVAGCNQPRPKARPASLDAPKVKPSAKKPTANEVIKRRWWHFRKPKSV